MMNSQTAIIIGGGPAGLTTAYELVTRSKIKPIVLEKSAYLGGIARTVNHKGNRIDLGGHRFFSKSERVMQWWLNIFPLEKDPDKTKTKDEIMLERQRLSRIYFRRKFFAYPVKLNFATLRNLGILTSFLIGLSYFRALIFPVKPENNLEDFFINRFGRKLYETFFKSYTEKVWGIPCVQISAAWGAQRIKGLSILKTVKHYLRQSVKRQADLKQKDTETSLIDKFLYPKFGPGQLWESVGRQIQEKGGTVLTGHNVQKLIIKNQKIVAVIVRNQEGEVKKFSADYVFSTMPIKELVSALQTEVPAEIKKISAGLIYRDFMTVGLLLKNLKIKDPDGQMVRDNWIYIQEPEVELGRLQIFNNWSPYLVVDPQTVWLGLEYFCFEDDPLWRKNNPAMIQFSIQELAKIGIIDPADVLDATVLRMPKAYPAYFGTYDQFPELKKYLNQFENLFLIGRNGMHRYNNMDHSMLTAMTAVDNVLAGRKTKENLWQINTEEEYHEAKSQ